MAYPSIEQSRPIQKPASVMLDSFWDGVLRGRFQECSDEYIHSLLRTRILSEKPLTALSFGEENTLYLEIFNSYKFGLNKWFANDLCGNPVIYLPPHTTHPRLTGSDWWWKVDSNKPTFLAQDAALGAKNMGYIPLQTSGKIRLFTDPKIWERADIISNNLKTGVLSMGSRPFF